MINNASKALFKQYQIIQKYAHIIIAIHFYKYSISYIQYIFYYHHFSSSTVSMILRLDKILKFYNSYQNYFKKKTRNSLMEHFTFVHATIFRLYRAFPFLFELRTIYDWTFSVTSLNLFQWIKVEDSNKILYIYCRYLVNYIFLISFNIIDI